jgi:hypothetical protein
MWAAGISPWEICMPKPKEEVEATKIGLWDFIDAKMGVRSLGFAIDPPIAGESYRFWFTLINRKDEEVKIESVKTFFDKKEITTTCAWLKVEDEKTFLIPGETECSATLEVPIDARSLKFKVTTSWTQSVMGMDEMKILASTDYYDPYYRPICYVEEGRSYRCPTTTEGPIDLIFAFVPKQAIVGMTDIIEFVVRISNEKIGDPVTFTAAPDVTLTEGLSYEVDCIGEVPRLTAATLSKSYICKLMGWKELEVEIYKEIHGRAYIHYTYTRSFSFPSLRVVRE